MSSKSPIKNLDEYYKARVYKEQKKLSSQTAIGTMSDYQADIFFVKQHSKSMISFIALINVEIRKVYVYQASNLKKQTIVEFFKINSYKIFLKANIQVELPKNSKLFYLNKSNYKKSYAIHSCSIYNSFN